MRALHSREQVLSADQRPSAEIRVPEEFRERVEVNVATLITGYDYASTWVVERGETQLVGGGRRIGQLLTGIGVHDLPLLTVIDQSERQVVAWDAGYFRSERIRLTSGPAHSSSFGRGLPM